MDLWLSTICLISERRKRNVLSGPSRRTEMETSEIKFGDCLAYAERLGADMVATGHYARVAEDNGRHTSTMLEARTLMFFFKLPVYSVRSGHVPVIANPALITASRNVSHPVLLRTPSDFSSDCLKA